MKTYKPTPVIYQAPDNVKTLVLVEIVQCPQHCTEAVAIDGIMVSGPECCGKWKAVKSIWSRGAFIMGAISESEDIEDKG